MRRIVLPTAVAELLKLMDKIIAQDIEEPNTLALFLAEQKINLEAASTHNDRKNDQSKMSENERQLRDKQFKPVFAVTRGIAFAAARL